MSAVLAPLTARPWWKHGGRHHLPAAAPGQGLRSQSAWHLTRTPVINRARARERPVRLAACCAFTPHTAPAVYAGWSGLALLAYVAYWAVLQRVTPRGKPERDLIDKVKNPGALKLFLGVAAVELAVVFLLPWAAAAAGGAWVAAAMYFLPIAVMTAVNISAESFMRRRGHIVAVYSSTGANNLWRLCAYFAALLDIRASLAAAGAGGAASGAALAAAAGAAAPLRLVAWTGMAVSCLIILIFEPAAMALISVQQEQPVAQQ